MQLNKYFALLLILSSFTLSAFADINDSGAKVKWGYIGNIGPERWAQLDPRFALCASGKSQSPINILKNVKNTPSKLLVHYEPSTLTLVNDGTTELMLNQTQTIIDDGHGVQVNFPVEPDREYVEFVGERYRLIQFHFHSPSENEWHGRAFPLEIHFVHQGGNGKVLVIGVFVAGGSENPAVKKILANLPAVKGEVKVVEGENINPALLLPSKQDFYYFDGSLTTPPCAEGVQWLVMPTPIQASPAQIVMLRKAMNGSNARPVQPLRGRQIYYNSLAKIKHKVYKS